ncbi:MAG: 5-hydroxyisourate hydrolase [Bacteriovoracaceae bacterium]|jgi:5-hydroxyisourate hydrolase
MISTHILDTSLGSPAAGVKVTLEMFDNENWKEISKGETNADGRFVFDNESVQGKYRINFFTIDYFIKNKTESFFLDTPVAFHVIDTNRKYHVPLLLNPFGYSTYRGS